MIENAWRQKWKYAAGKAWIDLQRGFSAYKLSSGNAAHETVVKAL
jgi:hypothetical protein